MGPQVQLIRTDELILEPKPGPRRSEDQPNRSVAAIPERFPRVIVTPDKHVIAGRSYVEECRRKQQTTIYCRVIRADDLDSVLTAVHNRILYGQLAQAELRDALNQYEELCGYREVRETTSQTE